MEQADPHCVLCHSAEREPLFRQGDWTVYRCCGCGLALLDPRPNADELSALYRSDYFQSHFDAGLKVGSPEMERRLSQEAHRLRFFQGRKPRGRLLDIGCGRGYFLFACRRRGYQVEGLDISADSADYVRSELGIPVAVGPIDRIEYPASSFDIVTMWHFLEHAREPALYLKKVGPWLKPDGILVVDVPNYQGTDARKQWDCWTGWDLPYHCYHFTPQTLERLLAQAGFRTIRRKQYLSEYIKERLERTGVLKPIARLVARCYSGHSVAVVALKDPQWDGKR